MVEAIDEDWNTTDATDSVLNKVTVGQGTVFPLTWPVDRLFWKLDENKQYKNIGTVGDPFFVLTSSGANYGDGSDGDVVISVNTTLTAEMNYKSLTINPGITLNTSGFIFRVTGETFNDNGSITDFDSGGQTSGATGAIKNGYRAGGAGRDGLDGNPGTGASPGPGGLKGLFGKGGGIVVFYTRILNNQGNINANGIDGTNATNGGNATGDKSGGGSGGTGGSGGQGGIVSITYSTVISFGTITSIGGNAGLSGSGGNGSPAGSGTGIGGAGVKGADGHDGNNGLGGKGNPGGPFTGPGVDGEDAASSGASGGSGSGAGGDATGGGAPGKGTKTTTNFTAPILRES